MNPKIKIIEEFIQIDEECDSIVLSYNGVSFKYHTLLENIKDMKYDEKSTGTVIGFIIPALLKYCVGIDVSFDLQGSNKLYNIKDHREILSITMNIPRCLCEIIYHDEVVKLNFSKNFEESIRNNFNVV